MTLHRIKLDNFDITALFIIMWRNQLGFCQHFLKAVHGHFKCFTTK